MVGLAVLGAFVWQVLFTPVAEEARASTALREPPGPERYRPRGQRLLRQPRHR